MKEKQLEILETQLLAALANANNWSLKDVKDKLTRFKTKDKLEVAYLFDYKKPTEKLAFKIVANEADKTFEINAPMLVQFKK